jgi:hypothetical protein
MRRTGVFFLSGSILAAVILCAAGASSEPPKESSEIEQLRKEVAELRQRISSVEDRMRDRSIITVRPYPPHRPIPKNWRPFEFNGMTYYVIPIDNAAKPGGEIDPNK